MKKVEDKGVTELARVIAYLDGKEISKKLLMYIEVDEGFDVRDTLKILSGYSSIKKERRYRSLRHAQSTTTIFQR